VVGVAAACDIVRDDAGLIAAILMGLAVANLRGFDVPDKRPFFETLVQLIIGVLFVGISATVTPESLKHIVLPTLGLVAVLVLVTRPLVAFFATIRTELTRGERAFTGWMAPRGIVAAATASTFGATLAAAHVGGASKILPVTFLVIVATVALYGLTAVPVARRLGVTRPARTRPLLIGSDPWVIDLARALRTAGLDVLMWASSDGQRTQIKQAGFELAPGEQLASAAAQGAGFEGVTAVLLLTGEDDYNTLAATTLAGNSDTPVYRLPPSQSGVVASYAPRRCALHPGPHPPGPGRSPHRRRPHHHPGVRWRDPPGHRPFVPGQPQRHADPGNTLPPPDPQPGDTLVLLGPGGKERRRSGGRPGRRSGLRAVVNLGAMVNVEHVNDAGFLIDPVDDPVGTTPGTVATGERTEQWLADAMRVGGEPGIAELQHGGRHSFREPLGDSSPRGRLEPDLVWLRSFAGHAPVARRRARS